MCDFQPGDVVVCVDISAAPARTTEYNYLPPPLELGRTYTIAQVGLRSHDDEYAVLLSDGPPCEPTKTPLYRHWRFRRVYRPDGSLISKLLEPVDLEVRA